MNKKAKWGGLRENAGRPKSANPKKTVVIRVDELLLPIIKSIKERYLAGEEIEALLSVTNNQDDRKSNESESIKGELDKYKEANLKLVQRYDIEHLELIELQGKRMSNQSTIKALRQQIEALKHLEYDCQAITKTRTRCTRPAKVKTNWHGVEIHVCLQHAK